MIFSTNWCYTDGLLNETINVEEVHYLNQCVIERLQVGFFLSFQGYEIYADTLRFHLTSIGGFLCFLSKEDGRKKRRRSRQNGRAPSFHIPTYLAN